jgi:hypothetical protein
MAKANKTQEKLFRIIGDLEQKLEHTDELKMLTKDICEVRYLDGKGRTLAEVIKELRTLI